VITVRLLTYYQKKFLMGFFVKINVRCLAHQYFQTILPEISDKLFVANHVKIISFSGNFNNNNKHVEAKISLLTVPLIRNTVTMSTMEWQNDWSSISAGSFTTYNQLQKKSPTHSQFEAVTSMVDYWTQTQTRTSEWPK